jgi:hypothetical protein
MASRLRSHVLPGSDPNGTRLFDNAPCWIRTSDRLLRRQLLYPAELREPEINRPGLVAVSSRTP